MMDICYDMTKLSNLNSGLGQYCYHIGRVISEKKEGVKVGFYTPSKQADIFGKNHFYFNPKKHHRWFGINVKTKIWHAMHQEVKQLPKDPSIKKILTIHDLNFLTKYDGKKAKMKLESVQRLVDKMDGIIYISKYTEKDCKKHLEIPSVPQRVIYNGLSLEENIISKKPSFITDNQSFLFSIGIISEKKNFHTLIKMMRFLPEKKIYICGNKKSKYAQNILKLIEENNLSNRCFLPGEITENEKIWLYENCSSFVFPSLSEGFGLPVIEAMSFGKPVVLSNKTSLPEIGGDIANYFENFEAEKMAEKIKYSEQIYNIKKAAESKLHAAKFSWENTVEQYLSLYQEVLRS